jgi:hypothetical protein
VGLTPWALHIGGRFTPLTEWDGYGPVQGSNGGHYALFTPPARWRGLQPVHLGRMLIYRLRQPEGHRPAIQLPSSGCGSCLAEHQRRAHHARAGRRAHAPVVPGLLPGPLARAGPAGANSDDAFTQVFTPRGAIRSVTSTADSGHAAGALRFGSQAGLDVACTALAR